MAIAFVASSGFQNVADPPSTSMTLTIPSVAGITSGTWVWIWVNVADNANAVFPTVSLTSTGTAPVQVGTTLQGASHTVGQLWQIPVVSADQGATVTVTADRQCFFGAVGAAWSGGNATQGGNAAFGTGASGTSFTAPSTTTTADGSWAVGAASIIGGAAFTATPQPAGYTLREKDADNQRGAIADTAASVGNSGTTIGGGTWSSAGNGPWIGVTFEILAVSGTTVSGAVSALALAAPAGTPSGPGVGGPVSALALAAPAGTPAGSGAATIAGQVATLALAAPPGVPSVTGFGGPLGQRWRIQSVRDIDTNLQGSRGIGWS